MADRWAAEYRGQSMDDMYDIRGRKRGANWTTMNRIIRGESVNEGCLYQGGWLAAGDLERMRDHNMGLVINCTINVEDPPWINQPDAPRYLRFPIVNRDMWNAYDSNSTLEALKGLFGMVDETLRCQNVMVQCRAGIHRAGTMASILCMHLLHLTPQDAIRHVRHKRAGPPIVGGCLAMVQQVFAEMERSRPPLPAAPAAPRTPPKAVPRVRLNPAPRWPPPELARAAAKAVFEAFVGGCARSLSGWQGHCIPSEDAGWELRWKLLAAALAGNRSGTTATTSQVEGQRSRPLQKARREWQ